MPFFVTMLKLGPALAVPKVVAQGADDNFAWLILEWLELHALDGPSAAALGAGLAAQHRAPQARFGWASDNFIGASVQANGWSDDWTAFWRDRRLHAQAFTVVRRQPR